MSGSVKSILAASGLLFALGFYLIFSGCTMLLTSDEYPDFVVVRSNRELLVVESEIYNTLEYSVNQYIDDLADEGSFVEVYIWQGGTASDLKSTIEMYYTENSIDGALLVGNLPTFWFEQNAFGRYEQFPCDLYFMDFDSTWRDDDNDGIVDYHSQLNLEIFVSRLAGTSIELIRYFDKVHMFRKGQLIVDESAYIFKDNSWSDYKRGSSFGLGRIFDSVIISEKLNETVKSNYISALTTSGAEYVYQWIHSYPPLLAVEGNNSNEYIHTSDILSNNFKGLFYNLFNCSAARFTQDNLAMTYLLRTDYGLATIGSTKVGGNYYPKVFHNVLAENGTWGDAYKAWYNYYGVNDDKWFLGMIILGDPMLVVSREIQKGLQTMAVGIVPPSVEEIEELGNKILEFGYDYTGDSFEEYKYQNPHFFND